MVGRAIIAPVSLSRAEIARVYRMLGELRTYRQEFETVSSADDLPPAVRNIEGFIADNDGSYAGLAYKTDISGSDYINGAAVFKKD